MASNICTVMSSLKLRTPTQASSSRMFTVQLSVRSHCVSCIISRIFFCGAGPSLHVARYFACRSVLFSFGCTYCLPWLILQDLICILQDIFDCWLVLFSFGCTYCLARLTLQDLICILQDILTVGLFCSVLVAPIAYQFDTAGFCLHLVESLSIESVLLYLCCINCQPCLVLQDLVTRGGKFVFLYKRCGRRVIINDGGQMMVAPSSIEAWVQQNTIGELSTPMHYARAGVLLYPANFVISLFVFCGSSVETWVQQNTIGELSVPMHYARAGVLLHPANCVLSLFVFC